MTPTEALADPVHEWHRDLIAAAEERGWRVVALDALIEGERWNVVLEEPRNHGIRLALAGVFVTPDFVRSLPRVHP